MSQSDSTNKGGIDPENRKFIAALIIGISVILLFTILYSNIGANDELGNITSELTSKETHTIVFENGTKITTTTYVTPPDTLSQVIKDLTQTRKDSNQEMLTTLMTAISAWVGAIIAFYFGKDYLVKLAETNKNLIVANTKLASNIGGKPKTDTLGDLLSQKPDSSNVIKYQLTDKIVPDDITKSLTKYGSTFLFTQDNDGKTIVPYGMLYKSGWEKAEHVFDHYTLINNMKESHKTNMTIIDEEITKLKDELANDPSKQTDIDKLEKNKKELQKSIDDLDGEISKIAQKLSLEKDPFESLVKEISDDSNKKKTLLNLVIDKITGKIWNEKTGFENFKRASPTDKITDTLKSMKDTFDSNVIGNVFVLVFSEDGTLRGIMGHSDLVNASETAS